MSCTSARGGNTYDNPMLDMLKLFAMPLLPAVSVSSSFLRLGSHLSSGSGFRPVMRVLFVSGGP